jgi:hypothetical protein
MFSALRLLQPRSPNRRVCNPLKNRYLLNCGVVVLATFFNGNSSIPINHSLYKYENLILFPKKLAKANEMLHKIGLLKQKIVVIKPYNI